MHVKPAKNEAFMSNTRHIHPTDNEHHETVLYENPGNVGSLIVFVFDNGRCGLSHLFWGSEMDYERDPNGQVEINYIWDEDNTKLLMLRTGTKNGADLVQAIYKRFGTSGCHADAKIKSWCDEKGIRYTTLS